MSYITTEAAARAAGYTVELLADSSEHSLELLVKPDHDRDGCFVAWDLNGGELLRVNGWLFTYETAAAGEPGAPAACAYGRGGELY